MKKYLCFSIVTLSIISCKKDPLPNEPDAIQQSTFEPGHGMFICNEGNYMFGNAKVSYYDFDAGALTTDVFEPKNHRPLGDVCQSMTVFNGGGYIVVNNSGKVEVVDMNDFSSVATITGFNSPRYFLAVSSTKAYVTDLYSDAVSIVNLSTNAISGSIGCIGWTEELIQSGDNVYVANYERGRVFVINSLTDQIIDSIAVTKGASSLRLDHSGKLWVMCSGEASSSTLGVLYKIDPTTNTIESALPFASAESPWRLTLNGGGDTLYYLNHGVNKMWVGASALPSSVFIPQGTKTFYALGINPVNRDIYVSDAIDYVQAGRVYRYNASGILQNDFLASIIPGDFIFY